LQAKNFILDILPRVLSGAARGYLFLNRLFLNSYLIICIYFSNLFSVRLSYGTLNKDAEEVIMLNIINAAKYIKRLTSKDNEDFPGTIIWLYYCFRAAPAF
jgi:hypothetical protein